MYTTWLISIHVLPVWFEELWLGPILRWVMYVMNWNNYYTILRNCLIIYHCCLWSMSIYSEKIMYKINIIIIQLLTRLIHSHPHIHLHVYYWSIHLIFIHPYIHSSVFYNNKTINPLIQPCICHLFIHSSIYMSIDPSTHHPIHQYIHLSIHPSIHLSYTGAGGYRRSDSCNTISKYEMFWAASYKVASYIP